MHRHTQHTNWHPQILQQRGEVDAREWRFLLAGPTAAPAAAAAARRASNTSEPRGGPAGKHSGQQQPANPGAGWLIDKSWGEVVALSGLPAFAGFDAHVAENEAHYHALFDSAQVGG